MLGLKEIQAASRKAARDSTKAKLIPYIVEAEDIDNMPPFPFPFIGYRVPRGWKKLTEHFVDSSGFGQPGERAMTVGELLDKLVVGHGYAITEVGQFQVYVGEYEKR